MAFATEITAEELEPPLGLIDLCHHRWAIPVLATLHRLRGGKLVTLLNALELPRATLSRTIDALTDLDFVMRNPGYGHPMRPEYLLTPFGEEVGPACGAVWARVVGHDLQGVVGRKWSLPVLWALGEGIDRFNESLAALPGLTPRALTMALTELEDAGLVERTVTTDRPPSVRYALTRPGAALARDAEALASALRFEA